MAHFAGVDKQPQADVAPLESLSVEDKLKRCIINGEKALGDGAQKQTLEQILEDALTKYSPLEIINTVLLDGMKTVVFR